MACPVESEETTPFESVPVPAVAQVLSVKAESVMLAEGTTFANASTAKTTGWVGNAVPAATDPPGWVENVKALSAPKVTVNAAEEQLVDNAPLPAFT